jgi:hypothetical protein
MANAKNRYLQIIASIFDKHYQRGASEVEFARDEIVSAARRLKIVLPKNLGDVLYSFRYRVDLPSSITRHAAPGHEWIIRPAGRALYRFVLTPKGAANIKPSAVLAETKVLDSTPGVIAAYALSDEQALLAKLRYNRLIDIFTGLTCYSLQNHLRTTAPGMGQVETDEIYIGMDKRGVHFVLPVQGKGGRDKIGVVQIEQDFAVCKAKFPALICRPIAAQFMADDLIALFAFEHVDDAIKVIDEKHYRLVHPEALSAQELQAYQRRQL